MFFLLIYEGLDWDGNDDYFVLILGGLADMLTIVVLFGCVYVVVLRGLYTSHCFVISEYLDEGMLIPKNTSVLIRRVPGRPRKPIVTAPVSEQEEYCLTPFKLLSICFTS